MSIETCLTPWRPSFPVPRCYVRRGETAITLTTGDCQEDGVRIKCGMVLWFRPGVGFVLQFSRGQLCSPEFHGTADHSYPPGAEAGRCRGCLQHPGALQGIQIAVVSRRAGVSPESLPRVVHGPS